MVCPSGNYTTSHIFTMVFLQLCAAHGCVQSGTFILMFQRNKLPLSSVLVITYKTPSGAREKLLHLSCLHVHCTSYIR
jgi:hypothetical protein